jgi:tRNA pseudouridine38-40 synthase
MPRYKLTVAYDGTLFHGWQKQASTRPAATDGEPAPAPPPAEPVRTVQHVLEQAVREVMREPVNLIGASRTDAGVHARGQVAAFSSTREFPLDRITPAINARLPDDVRIMRAEVVPETFSPISDAIAKGYIYRLAFNPAPGTARRQSPSSPSSGDTVGGSSGSVSAAAIASGLARPFIQPLFDRHFTAWTAYHLDPAAMNEAARHFIGEHDFTSFTRLHHGRESTVRTIYDCKVEITRRARLMRGGTAPAACRLVIAGNGFLYNMIRIIAGTLLEVGRGELVPEAIPAIFAARSRTTAGPTMPPHGLCLMWVRYADDACSIR